MLTLNEEETADYKAWEAGCKTLPDTKQGKCSDVCKRSEEGREVVAAIRDLLALMHGGDGGHYTYKVGLLQSIKDAQKRYLETFPQ